MLINRKIYNELWDDVIKNSVFEENEGFHMKGGNKVWSFDIWMINSQIKTHTFVEYQIFTRESHSFMIDFREDRDDSDSLHSLIMTIKDHVERLIF